LRKERAAALRAAGAVQVSRFLDAQVGVTADVLVEKDSGQGGEGRSPHFAHVRIEGEFETGAIVSARIVGRDNDTLIAHKAA
jgi:threonylcarbamoyladenosine tRNA methylthiotransferase MtaB